MDDPFRPRALTEAELDAIFEAFKDPEYRRALLADAERLNMVEVDNPMRREVRPRRGTDEVS